MNLRATSFLMLPALAAGCGLVFDYSGYHGTGGATTTSTGGGASSSGTSSGSGTGGSGGAPTTSSAGGAGGTANSTTSSSTGGGCPAQTTCLAVPAGWSGPIVLETSQGTPICGQSAWSTLVNALRGGYGVVPPTACGPCSCDGPSGGACPGTISVSEYSTSCSVVPTVDHSVATSCHQTALSDFFFAGGPLPAASGASCTGNTPDPTSKATFATNAIGCAPPAPTSSCAGGACYPTTAHPCVYVAGSASCPSDYPDKNEIYTTLTDSYTCTQCACTADGVTCNPTLSLYYDTLCTNHVANLTLDGTCLPCGGGANSAKIVATGTPSGGSCSVSSGGVLMGSASFSGETTVCCQ